MVMHGCARAKQQINLWNANLRRQEAIMCPASQYLLDRTHNHSKVICRSGYHTLLTSSASARSVFSKQRTTVVARKGRQLFNANPNHELIVGFLKSQVNSGTHELLSVHPNLSSFAATVPADFKPKPHRPSIPDAGNTSITHPSILYLSKLGRQWNW